VPFDVSAETLYASAGALTNEYPQLAVNGFVGDFERHLTALPRGGRRLLAFLGSTIGNLPPPTRSRFLRDVAQQLDGGDSFLLGLDLVKNSARIVAAYDDAAGVTAAFNLNVLHVLNRELDADLTLRRSRTSPRGTPRRNGWRCQSVRFTGKRCD
jgi:L-histidine N-alpha-methyltransferase